MSDEAILLSGALQNVHQELDRLGKLVRPQNNTLPDELQKDSETFHMLFMKDWETLNGEWQRIADEFEQPNADPTRFSALWAKYARLRYERLPKLTGELLAVIGGIHLRQLGLDQLGSDKGISFTSVAQQLVAEDLSTRSNYQMHSLLIVAEERYEPSQARILRLRFPACDVWHLSFTAYEHGYHFAHDSDIESVRRLRADVESAVDPISHHFGLPLDKLCFLPEVTAFWERFQEAFKAIDPQEKKAFYETRRSEIETLQHRQVVNLCRLLADAFATFYVGPAYVYALLHLSFTPIVLGQSAANAPVAYVALDEPVSPWMPPFLQRLVVSLEILHWMHQEAIIRDNGAGFDPLLFVEGTGESPSGILGTYYQTCMAINNLTSVEKLQSCYEEAKKSLAPWLERFKEIFSEKGTARKDTLANWYQVKKLLVYLDGDAGDFSDDYSLWGVMNAAWHLRHQKEGGPLANAMRRSQISAIEERAMALIIRKVSTQTGGGAQQGRTSLSTTATGVGTNLQHIRQVHIGATLYAKEKAKGANNTAVVELLEGMIETDRFRESTVVMGFLQQTTDLGDNYVQAFRWLYGQDAKGESASPGMQSRRRDDDFSSRP